MTYKISYKNRMTTSIYCVKIYTKITRGGFLKLNKKFKNLLMFLFVTCMMYITFSQTEVYASTVLHQDSNVSITYNGITKESYDNGYDINLLVENFSNRSLVIECEEISINGYMAYSALYIKVAPGKKAIDSIYVNEEYAKLVPINSINEIEVIFNIYDSNDYDFEYKSKRIRLKLTHNSSSGSSHGNGNSGFSGSSLESGNNTISPSITANACKGFPSKVNIPVSNMQNLTLRCADNCGFSGVRVGQSYVSVGSNSYVALVYNVVFDRSGTHTVTAYDSFGNAVSSILVNVSDKHSYGTFGDRVKLPTCTEDGMTVYTCSVCGFKNIETEKATGHSYNSGIITQQSTCTKNGIKTHTCTKCKDSYTEEIPAIGSHSFSEWKVFEKPTALEEGEEIRVCSVCEEEETRVLEKLEAFVNLSSKKITLKAGKTYNLKISDCAYGDAAQNWKSSNKKIAKINRKNDKSFIIKAGKKGNCKITIMR